MIESRKAQRALPGRAGEPAEPDVVEEREKVRIED